MKKVLFITHVLKHPPIGGPYLRIENSIKALNKICELYLLSRVHKNFIGDSNAEYFFKKNSHVFLYSPSVKKNNFLIRVWRKCFGVFYKTKIKSIIEQDAIFIVEYALKNNIDVLWFGYGNISYDLMKKIKELNPELKMVCDTDSVFSRFILRGIPHENSIERKKQIELEGRIKEQEEKEWVEFCDVTTAVSEVDAQYYRSLTNDFYKIKIFSNVIDINNYSLKEKVEIDIKNPSIYLAGTFGVNSPMSHAATWFIDKVLPLIRNKIPDIFLYLVGKDGDKVFKDNKDDFIIITGQVVSVLPYLQNVDVAIVPLWFESGTRFKIMEAGACEVPVVSTTLGAEGLDVTNGKDIFIADKPEDFADAILKILKEKDLAKKMSKSLKELIHKECSLEKLMREGKEILNFLDSKNAIISNKSDFVGKSCER